mmetsp:Transcript_65224/g.155782  ORF Transcript_65224/g.155782 Transcript_65224/m.155782 type:complete len:367 (+) Transcript_65224:74-1174(+)
MSQVFPSLFAKFFLAFFCLQPSVAAAKQEFKLHIPRITVEELQTNATIRSGLHSYVLTGHVESQWKAANWTLSYLLKKIPFEWVDYYENNMRDPSSKPFLFRFQDALPRFQQKTGTPRYMQLRLSLRGWKRLKKDFEPLPNPEIFWSDEEWIEKCMKKAESGKVDAEAVDNFYTTNQWKFLLIGEEGTTMFFHQDGTASSSWQAQLVGRKKWTLCPHTETRFLSPQVDTFSEAGQKDPKFSQALCGQVEVNPGELLYYPGYWWHQTMQLESPSIGYTGALVGTEVNRKDIGSDGRPHAAFYNDVQKKCAKCWTRGEEQRKCDDISLKWPGAAPPPFRVVCEEYLPQCFKLWDEHAKDLSRPKRSEL